MRDIRLARRTTEKRAVQIWSDADIAAFVKMADKRGWSSLGTAVMIALDTGQRQGDVLAMRQPRDYANGLFKFKQSKTGATVSIKAAPPLVARLSALPSTQPMLVRQENTHQQWRADTFRHRFREIADAAGLQEHIFQQLRHTALVNAERAGLTEVEICHKFGWSRATVREMRDENYGLLHDEEIANATVEKLEKLPAVQKMKGLHTFPN